MGENLGFLLPAWLIGAPLALGILEMMKTTKMDHSTASTAGTVPARPKTNDMALASQAVTLPAKTTDPGLGQTPRT